MNSPWPTGPLMSQFLPRNPQRLSPAMPVLCLVVVVASLSLSLAAPAVADEAAQNTTDPCQLPSFRCDTIDVRYPFLLANATHVVEGGTAYAYCGYSGMAIACDSGRPTLKLEGDNNYTVLDIDYVNRVVTVADTDVLVSGGDCPRVTHNVTVPAPGTWQNLSSVDANDYLAFFYDCAFTAAAVPPPPPYIREINCSSFHRRDSRTPSFVARLVDMSPKDQWPRACSKVFVAPVLKDSPLLRRENYARLSSGGYGQLLKQGFQLAWDLSAGSCNLCGESNGQCSYNDVGEFMGCLCDDGSVQSQHCGLPSSKKKGFPSSTGLPSSKKKGFPSSKKKTAAYIGSAVSSAILLSLLFLMCILKKFYGMISCIRGSKHAPSIESFLQKHEAQHPKRYTYSEVKRMTKSFAEKLGQGGFGTVYKGNLPSGRLIAVKLLSNSKDDGQEFINEVASIMRTSHVNVVMLLGYCLQGSKRALIYEYMPNGSLERFGFGQNSEGKNSLSWEKLFDITIGIARGLEYLHRGCSTRIVHFDIKPQNILLDQDFCPKISDFGLAKLCMKKESIISIDGARGTIGYIAPEVFSKQFGEVSIKSDVYSFGMVILEMVGARKNINKSSEASSKYFPQWVYEHLEEYCVNTGELSGDTELVRKLIVVGLWCIQLQPSNRPSMTRVLEMLESKENDLQIPPQSLLC